MQKISPNGELLFRVRRDGMEDVGLLLNRKIEAPRSADSGLLDVARLVVFVRSQGWVAQVLKQEN